MNGDEWRVVSKVMMFGRVVNGGEIRLTCLVCAPDGRQYLSHPPDLVITNRFQKSEGEVTGLP